jgi:hypothetical protein
MGLDKYPGLITYLGGGVTLYGMYLLGRQKKEKEI